jgi:hypothetical protein
MLPPKKESNNRREVRCTCASEGNEAWKKKKQKKIFVHRMLALRAEGTLDKELLSEV